MTQTRGAKAKDSGLLEAQVAVLGAMLIDPDVVGAVLSKTTEAMFVASAYRTIYLAIRHLFAENRAIDTVTVRAVVGADYESTILQIVEVTPTSGNVDEYIDILRRDSAVYRCNNVGLSLASANTEEECRQLVDKANLALRDRSEIDYFDPTSAWQDFMGRHTGSVKFLPWGIRQLDNTLTVRLGHYVVLGGYSSDGKTCLALQFAAAQAKKYRVGYFTLEQDKTEIEDRIYSAATGIPLRRISSNELHDKDWTLLGYRAEALSHDQLRVYNARSFSVQDIASVALAQHLEIVYVDYVQLIRPPRTAQRESLADQVSEITKGLQSLAYGNGITVVALSQLTPGDNHKKNMAADMYDLRGSKQLGMDADVVMILQRIDSADKRSNRRLTIDKNRQGPAGGYADLILHGEIQRFEAVSKDRIEPQEDTREVRGQVGFAEVDEDGDEPF